MISPNCALDTINSTFQSLLIWKSNAYDFADEAEKDLIDELFDNLEIIEINKEIADQAIIYRKNKTKKIKLPDAIILATAKYVAADLLTDNHDDFQNIDSTVNVKDIDDLKI